ncbi:MAG: Hpt domain-containing protein [Campylobacterota bacterium]|nr:Hpt domain-containing protein [Campylobacterota bacterium]
MLIYNFQKEFLGIDEKDLRTLGFKDLAGLRTEVTDFSDLFVKTPGYIHNFKHVHWIDFITCADSNEESKVIINVNNKNYKCIIQISTAYLVDNPSSKAYLVSLNNLRELSAKESEGISGDITQRQAPQVTADTKPIFNSPQSSSDIEAPNLNLAEEAVQTLTVDPYEAPLEIDFDDNTEDIALDSYDEAPLIEVEESFTTPLEATQEEYTAPLNIEIEDDLMSEDLAVEEPQTVMETVVENYDNGYMYDPTVASEELGLPLDLIEEFIQDFIEQAKEFKDGLYTSLDENDLDNLKILSHKLKGVAANLRIEDALEALTIINTSAKIPVVKENLDTLYKIIAKLAGEEITTEKEVQVAPTVAPVSDIVEIDQDVEDEDDFLSLDFKDDEDDLYSDPVEPTSIEVPDEIELSDEIEIVEPKEELALVEEKIDIDMDEPLDLLDEEEFTLDLDEDVEIEKEAELTPEIDISEEVEIAEEIEIDYSKENTASDIGLDIESFNELFEDYIQEANTSSRTIHDSIAQNDLQNCRNEAIRLKGMSDNMRINTYSQELETLIHSSDEQEMSEAIKKIDAAIAKLSTIGV